VAWLIEEGTWDMYYLGSYLSFLPWKIPELLVIEATEVYIKVGGWSSPFHTTSCHSQPQ
jgi:hypothetical protein